MDIFLKIVGALFVILIVSSIRNVFSNMICSFTVGSFSYISFGWWINQGKVEPTLSTSHIYWYLNGIFLVFWLVSFILLEVRDIKKLKE